MLYLTYVFRFKIKTLQDFVLLIDAIKRSKNLIKIIYQWSVIFARQLYKLWILSLCYIILKLYKNRHFYERMKSLEFQLNNAIQKCDINYSDAGEQRKKNRYQLQWCLYAKAYPLFIKMSLYYVLMNGRMAKLNCNCFEWKHECKLK